MHEHPVRRRIFQAVRLTVALVVVFVAVVGFAHTEHGRPLLRYIPGMGACPLDGVVLSAEDRARVRGEVLAPLAGERAAASRRALAFELGRTSVADVTAWAAEQGVTCSPGRKLGMRCTTVPARSLAGVAEFDEVSLEFDADGRLAAVEGSASLTDPARAAEYVATRDRALRDSLGEPVTIRGDAVATTVARGPLSQIAREFRTRDVRAGVVATNSGGGRFTIREYHQLIAG